MQPPKPGIPVQLSQNIRLLLAPNPGPMTHWGTNTYILGRDKVAVIDPGPANASHLDAIMRATSDALITHILVTHAHADHSPLARDLSKKSGAPVYGFGSPEAGRSSVMQRLARADVLEGGEGRDADFLPDIELRNGDIIEGHNWALQTIHTPGHFAGHLAFEYEDGLFSGDHVMDWSSTLISPPDGDLGAFMATCAALKQRNPKCLYPGHGAPIKDVEERLTWLINHRLEREVAILQALENTSLTLPALTETVYIDIPTHVLPIAARNVFAHLIDLVERNLVLAAPDLSTKAQFRKK